MKNSFLCVGSFLLAASFFTSCTEDKDWSGGLKNSDLVFQTCQQKVPKERNFLFEAIILERISAKSKYG